MLGADVRVSIAEQLPFSSDTFDAALAQLVVGRGARVRDPRAPAMSAALPVPQLMDDRDAGLPR